jgi:hypothetical protein
MATQELEGTGRGEDVEPQSEQIDTQQAETIMHWLGEGAQDAKVDPHRTKTFLNHLTDVTKKIKPAGQVSYQDVAGIGTGLIREVIDHLKDPKDTYHAARSAVKGIPSDVTRHLPEGLRGSDLHDAMLGIGHLVYSIRLNVYDRTGVNGVHTDLGMQMEAWKYFREGTDFFARAIAARFQKQNGTGK